MSTLPANQFRKEADIKREIKSWLEKLIYCKEYIYKQVAWKFYLEPETVARIWYGDYDRRREREQERAALDEAPLKMRRARKRKPQSKRYPK